jgi:hypothetical protein
MKKIIYNFKCLIIATTLIIVSCSKGPAGDTGPAGAQGPAGPAGSTGPQGTTGTANVIYSPWLNVTFDQVLDTNWLGQIPAPKLTDSILNKGEIKVYFNAGNDSTDNQFVLALPAYEPFFFTANNQPITLIINPYFTTQAITLVSNLDISSYKDDKGYNNFQFRYIIIPGGTTATAASINGENNSINWNDYKQVKKLLGLKD